MLRRSSIGLFAASRLLLSGGGHGPKEPYHNKDYPVMPHNMEIMEDFPEGWKKSPILSKLLDQSNATYDDVISGGARVAFQEPARYWQLFHADDALVLEEHDREEWNDKPYIGVNHLYEPPLGTEERPLRIEANGNPGDQQIVMCFGNCAPHVPQSTYHMLFKGYSKNKCPMCQQWFYVHNRPWLIMHPDWTDEPAADEGPAFTFAEIEAEFDRDFHEFGVYLNAE
jgi:hypothetical protein